MASYNVQEKVWEGIKFPYRFPMDTFMGEEILRRLKEAPERVAQVVLETNKEVTYEELRISSVRIAQNLMKIGITHDDVVGVICKTSNEMSFFLTACVLIGAPMNPLDLSFTKDDIKHLFGQTQPKLVICDIEAFDKTREALKELELAAKIFVTSDAKIDGAGNLIDLMTPTGNEDDFISPKFDQPSDEKLLAIMCSSGSTGMPKGVNMCQALIMSWTGFPKPEKTTRSILFSPMYWVTGFIPNILKAFDFDDLRVITSQAFSVEALIDAVKKYEVTTLTVPPIHLNTILNSDFGSSCNHEKLKNIMSVGSIVPETLRKKFAEVFPEKSMSIAYGMTEASVSMTKPGEYKEAFSVGSLIFPNTVVKIVDEEGQRLGVGVTGEIRAKGYFKFMVSWLVFHRSFKL
jgi:4-coumarate--CoA ligase